MSAVTLNSLAADINREHEAALEHARSAVRRARRAGELLLQAKEQCGHGEWLPWLKANCPAIAERTAQAYMRLARASVTEDPPTLRVALQRLSAPRDKSATVADSAALSATAPLVSGHISVGSIGSRDICALFESRRYPGYWHDIDMRHWTASTRPVKPQGLAVFLRQLGKLKWRTEPDDGQLLPFAERAEVSA